MYYSPAFNALTGFAPQLLTHILDRRQFENHGRKGKQKRVCINCDNLNITYTEFKNKFGITKSRLLRAKDQLLEKGFISIVHKGGGYKQDKAVVALSDKWVIWNQGMVMEIREKDTVVHGFCKPNK